MPGVPADQWEESELAELMKQRQLQHQRDRSAQHTDQVEYTEEEWEELQRQLPKNETGGDREGDSEK